MQNGEDAERKASTAPWLRINKREAGGLKKEGRSRSRREKNWGGTGEHHQERSLTRANRGSAADERGDLQFPARGGRARAAKQKEKKPGKKEKEAKEREGNDSEG